MDDAAKILIVGGVLNIAYSFLTGLVASNIRLKSPHVSKYLMLAHMGPLMWGPLLLSLVIALQLSDLSSGIETAAATLMVPRSVWMQRIPLIGAWKLKMSSRKNLHFLCC